MTIRDAVVDAVADRLIDVLKAQCESPQGATWGEVWCAQIAVLVAFAKREWPALPPAYKAVVIAAQMCLRECLDAAHAATERGDDEA
jgi:hypothetical protein